MQVNDQEAIQSGVRSLLSIAPVMPRSSTLGQELADCQAAQERGYFLPDEDARLRIVFADYLRVRAALHEVLAELEPLITREPALSQDERLRAFAVAWCAGCMLLRSAEFLSEHAHGMDVISAKLDEAEPRFNIPAGQFTAVYRSATHPATLTRLVRARAFAQAYKRPLAALQRDPEMAPVMALLHEVRKAIRGDRTHYVGKVVHFFRHAVRRRSLGAYRRTMFALFEASGRAIAEMRNPFHGKRVTAEVLDQVAPLLRAGDVIITRHDDAMSNLFLPGFWPHGALCIGTEAERKALGVTMDESRAMRSADPVRILEAKKDGVLFRMLPETLYVDAFTVIRPRLAPDEIAKALTHAISHEGKAYDFEFDFSRADRLVCTEVVYRAYHGTGPVHFELKPRSGRLCLSAEDVLDLATVAGVFEVVAVFGVDGNRLVTDGEAAEVLRHSYRVGGEIS